MEEKSITVKENVMAFRLVLLIGVALCLMFTIMGIVLFQPSEPGFIILVSICAPLTFICLFFSIFGQKFVRSTVTFDANKVVKKRGKKIIREIEWNDVERIQYFGSITMLLFSIVPTYFIVYVKKDSKEKKAGNLSLTFSKKEVTQIQEVIPIKIIVG